MVTKRNILSVGRNRVLAICLLTVALIVAAYNYRGMVGRSVWKYFHAESVATAINPKDASLQFAIGNYYFGGGSYDIEKAQSYFGKALEIDPMLQGPHYQLGRTYFIQSAFFDARREIDKEIELHPDFKRSYYMRGLVNGYTRHYAEAEFDFQEFLKWKPESWAAHNDLAWIYFQEGKYKEAAETAQEGLKDAPDNPWLLNSLGVALLNIGKKKEAKEAFTKALASLNAMSPKDWGAAYPGNNPRIYSEGFAKMEASVEANLKLLDPVDSERTSL